MVAVKAMILELLTTCERVGVKWTYFPVYPGHWVCSAPFRSEAVSFEPGSFSKAASTSGVGVIACVSQKAKQEMFESFFKVKNASSWICEWTSHFPHTCTLYFYGAINGKFSNIGGQNKDTKKTLNHLPNLPLGASFRGSVGSCAKPSQSTLSNQKALLFVHVSTMFVSGCVDQRLPYLESFKQKLYWQRPLQVQAASTSQINMWQHDKARHSNTSTCLWAIGRVSFKQQHTAVSRQRDCARPPGCGIFQESPAPSTTSLLQPVAGIGQLG